MVTTGVGLWPARRSLADDEHLPLHSRPLLLVRHERFERHAVREAADGFADG